jgi:hypothetical protein
VDFAEVADGNVLVGVSARGADGAEVVERSVAESAEEFPAEAGTRTATAACRVLRGAIIVEFAEVADGEALGKATLAAEVASTGATPQAARIDSQLEEMEPEELAGTFAPCIAVESPVVPTRV